MADRGKRSTRTRYKREYRQRMVRMDDAMKERHAAVWQLIRAKEIDGVLGLSYIVWPPELDDPDAGTAGVDVRRRRAA